MTCLRCGAVAPTGTTVCAVCGAPLPAAVPSTQLAARLRSPSADLALRPVQVGDVLIERYRLESVIGEGGMGTVFAAHDAELDRQVAVKILAPALLHDAEVLERFEREARLMAKLDHPHIVPIYDVGRHQGQPFIVMKRLKGDSLAGRLKRKGGFSPQETLHLMRQLASGLDYLHSLGLIHRDIKSGNIFLSPEGHATILDFGILRQKDASTGLTRAGMVMGTPHYMAPEQALGLTEVDHRVDLYALAVVLFECLTGTLPFEADSELKLIQMQAHAPVPEIADRAPWITPAVARVVTRALAKKPDDRFNTARELVAALEAAYVSVDTPTPQPDTAENIKALKRGRRPWVLWVALGALSATALLIWVYWFRTDVAAPEPQTSPVQAPLAQLPPEDPVPPEASLPEPSQPEERAETLDTGETMVLDAGSPEIVEPAVTPSKRVKKNGRINVITTFRGEPYWAQVSVDGVTRGRTPLLLELPVGRHSLVIERAGFKRHTKVIRVSSERAQVLKFELVP